MIFFHLDPKPKKIYQKEMPTVKKNISLTIKEEISKNSAIPPQTPNNALSFEDLVSFLYSKFPSLMVELRPLIE